MFVLRNLPNKSQTLYEFRNKEFSVWFWFECGGSHGQDISLDDPNWDKYS